MVTETGKIFLKPGERAPKSIPSTVSKVTPTQNKGESLVQAGIRSGGGGRGGVSGRGVISSREREIQQEKARAEAEARAKFEQQVREQQAMVERQRQEQQAMALREQLKIENLKKAIVQQGAQQREAILRNQEGQRIKQVVTEIKQIQQGRPTNVRIFESTNLDTGEKTIKTFERPKTGGGLRQSMGLVTVDESVLPKEKQITGFIEAGEWARGGVVSEALGLGRLTGALNDFRRTIRTKRLRGQSNVLDESFLLASGFVTGALDVLKGYVDLPQAVTYLATNP